MSVARITSAVADPEVIDEVEAAPKGRGV